MYVVEFWATWCGPCRESIPEVSALQQKYQGSVVMIGQNVWEHEEGLAVPFVAKMGDKMNYRVAIDDTHTLPEGTMATNWMQAAGQEAIPCAFVIDQAGKIAWIGHPMEMPAVLEKVVAKTWDMKAAIADAEEMARLKTYLDKCNEAIGAGDADAGLKTVDEMVKLFPKRVGDGADLKFKILLFTGNYDRAYAMADALYARLQDDAAQLNSMAWRLAADERTRKPNLALAEKLARRAVELTHQSDAGALDTLARVRFEQGHGDEAIAVETAALAKAPEDVREDIAKSLEGYKKGKTPQ